MKIKIKGETVGLHMSLELSGYLFSFGCLTLVK